ncbi:acyl-CoA thioesterase II [Mycobacterium sp. IS-1742]|uniref:acyl-CoA thioesterase n=1 Tax=Mycobacterium sp. IS-1742 TaxID=1772285 RepID=UPI00073FB8F1|nr:acyl-CoA thioesterase domain-containing protein [Mycobacterium sp. IS-1742]KUI32210.1 acyl-CoA thioesterase II [Mycobacterium sp. IS-1742]
MSRLLEFLDVAAGERADTWVGPPSGPAGKRAYGGHLAAQSLAAAARTVAPDRPPTAMHLQFLRGGEAGDAVVYEVTAVHDGRTTAARRVESRQAGRLLTAATVSFAVPMAGPEHGHRRLPAPGPDGLEPTGPPGPAPSVPLDELDIRVVDNGSGEDFVRRFWWRATVALPANPLLHTVIAVYVTDLYMIDPALQVHGHSMRARTHRSGTTDSSVWFHQPVRADEWNLLESTSPAAARGRGVITASLVRADGVIAATLAQEGLIAEREPRPH